MSDEKKRAVVQIWFDDVSRIRQAAEVMEYYMNLPLPGEVTASPTHTVRHRFLTELRTIFLDCYSQYVKGEEGLSPGPHFGSGGKVQQGPPPESSTVPSKGSAT